MSSNERPLISNERNGAFDATRESKQLTIGVASVPRVHVEAVAGTAWIRCRTGLLQSVLGNNASVDEGSAL